MSLNFRNSAERTIFSSPIRGNAFIHLLSYPTSRQFSESARNGL